MFYVINLVDKLMLSPDGLRIPLCILKSFLLTVVTLFLMTTSIIAQKGISVCCNDELVKVDSPVRIGYMPFEAVYTIENYSERRVVGYRLGCVVEKKGRINVRSTNKLQRVSIDAIDLSTPTIPFAYVNLRRTKAVCSAKRAKPTVVQVNFADGLIWRIDSDSHLQKYKNGESGADQGREN